MSFPKPPLSLTEILIGILAIGILGAVVVPNLQQAGEAADLAQCRSNLYEIGQATYLYSADNDGRTPPNIHGGETWNLAGTYVGGGGVFGRLLAEHQGGWGPVDYIGRPHHLFCPSNHPDLREKHGYQHPDEINEGNRISRMGYFFMYYAPGDLRSNASIYDDPRRPLVFDLGYSGAGLSPTFTLPSHASVLNVLHLGGHVSTVTIEEANEQNSLGALYDWLTDPSNVHQPSPLPGGTE